MPLIYFSASNNTAYVAQIIGKGLEGRGIRPEPVRVEDVAAGKYDLSCAKVIGVGAPVHGGFAEPIMRWAERVDFSGKKVFLFSTASKYHFTYTREMINLIRRRGGEVIGALEMRFTGTVDGVFYSKEQTDKHPLQRSGL